MLQNKTSWMQRVVSSPTLPGAPAAHPKRPCLDHLRVRSEMSLGGPLPNVSHARRQPKCTIYHDVTGSAPVGPSDRTMGLRGSARMEQGKAPSGSSRNPGGSWEGSHKKHKRQPDSVWLSGEDFHRVLKANQGRMDRPQTDPTQTLPAARMRHRPTWS